MEINARLKCDLHTLKFSKEKDSGTLYIKPILKAEVTFEEAKQLFGEDFAQVAFGGFAEHEGNPVPLFTNIKPSLGAVRHEIQLVGYGPLPAIPVLTGIAPVKGKRAVVATIECDLEFDAEADGDFGAQLLGKIGEVIDVRFAAAQQSLPGINGNGNGTDSEAAAEGEGGTKKKPAVGRTRAGPFGNGPRVPVQ